MTEEDLLFKRKKILHTVRSCPKCGNTEGILNMPGMGISYYFCPVCDKKDAKKHKERKHGK